MTSRIRIFDRPTGRVLVDVVSSANRTYKLNDFGKCTFEVGLDSRAALPEVMRFRNFVYVTHDGGLPAWGGYLFPPRTYSDVAGQVIMTAYSGERLLKLRRSESGTISGTPGDIFAGLVKLANRREDLRVRVGEVYSGGKNMTYKLGESETLYDDAKRLAAMSGCDWGIEPYLDASGNITFLANWYARRGFAPGVLLEQGVNFEAAENVLVEQGDLVNDMRVTGNGGASATARAEEWIGEYGLIEGAESYSAEKTPDTLDVYAGRAVQREARGRRTYRLKVGNRGGLFAALGLGNTYPANFAKIGRRASVRLLGMQYPDDAETVDLTVDEVLE